MKKVLYISIILFVIQLSAQKKVYKEVAYNSQRISIELHDVDQVELVHTNEQKITISMADYAENPTDLTIKETETYIYIASARIKPIQQAKTDKFCVEQPFFSSYTIAIPKDTEITVYYNNGNFSTKSFNGKLNLNLNKGNVDIQGFTGEITIELFKGSINAKIENTVIAIVSNHGKIISDLKFDKLKKTDTLLKGIYGNALNKLKVQSIHANILLSSIRTQ